MKRSNNERGVITEKLLFVIVVIIIVVLMLKALDNNKKENEDIGSIEPISQEAVIEEDKKEEFVEKKEDGSKLNVSPKAHEIKNVDGLEISNIQIKEVGGVTTLLADVTNTTSSKTEEKTINIEILDKHGNKITDLIGIIDPVEPGQTVKLNCGVTADVANAYDFEVNGL